MNVVLYQIEQVKVTDPWGIEVLAYEILDIVHCVPMGHIEMIIGGGNGERGPAKVAYGRDGHIYVNPPTVDYWGNPHWYDRTAGRSMRSRLPYGQRYIDSDGNHVDVT